MFLALEGFSEERYIGTFFYRYHRREKGKPECWKSCKDTEETQKRWYG